MCLLSPQETSFPHLHHSFVSCFTASLFTLATSSTHIGTLPPPSRRHFYFPPSSKIFARFPVYFLCITFKMGYLVYLDKTHHYDDEGWEIFYAGSYFNLFNHFSCSRVEGGRYLNKVNLRCYGWDIVCECLRKWKKFFFYFCMKKTTTTQESYVIMQSC